LIELLRPLQGYGEVIDMSSEIVEEPALPKRRSGVPPRYRHPLNPECEWTGRGRRPAWLKEFLQVPGRSIEQCRIQQP
jgi:DNA-binding protein H-NS